MTSAAEAPSAALRGALYVALSAAAFGAMAIFGRYAYAGGADVLGLLIVRFSIAGALLAVIARRRRVSWPRGRALGAIVGMGALGYVGQSLCYFSALQHAQASLVALLLYLYPAFVTLLAAWWLGERLTRAKAVALALCVAGSALMVGGGRGEPLGIALALGAAVVYSLYIVVGAKAARGVDPLATVAIICCAAAATLVALALVRTVAFDAPPHWPRAASGWAALVAIALVSTVAAMLAFFAGLERLGAARTSMLSTLEPVVTVALAASLFGETLTPLQWAGGVAILAAVLWLVRAGDAGDEAESKAIAGA
ncbi:DMT family transporter [Burkholderia oklahomensis]|uniref:DMT family transporter n=1 Tax=Burkholderia oklahomensis TaxID=342113 RepID=UPI00016A9082|nr:DMT family transporter [Burkholderia oklahomensis]AJX33237.1 eamA-like transporter family protein [Burkholderia oklahomensis C6786]AOI46661.1 multidrug DMT transporter permease [Burkholderia oklahomensis C6786]KUY62837.1 multidrug DMT transporter permease [Burkholderia oklahomensis C6786]MBI0360704.1 DMT family transporter [Burkholderia oklahomensis]SUW60082.1 putative DMT superfamily transporter inner membrane protein [Burkholderia oklahomensis]